MALSLLPQNLVCHQPFHGTWLRIGRTHPEIAGTQLPAEEAYERIKDPWQSSSYLPAVNVSGYTSTL
jgi:hypothetical protein